MASGTKKEANDSVLLNRAAIVSLDGKWLPQVVEIENSCFNNPWSHESLEQSLGAIYQTIGLVIPPNRLLGYIVYNFAADEVHILNVAVHLDYRRHGIAERLLEHLHQVAVAKGLKTSYLEVDRQNSGARKLYEKFGYYQIGSRKAYYQDTSDDALLLALDLSKL